MAGEEVYQDIRIERGWKVTREEWRMWFNPKWFGDSERPYPWETRHLRHLMRLKQNEFAEVMGVSWSLAQKMESQHKGIGLKNKKRFARLWWIVDRVREEDPYADFRKFSHPPSPSERSEKE